MTNQFEDFIDSYRCGNISEEYIINKIPTQKEFSIILKWFCNTYNAFDKICDNQTIKKLDILVKLIKHVTPLSKDITKFLIIISTIDSVTKYIDIYCIFINELYFNRKFKFSTKQLNLLKKINYYIDADKFSNKQISKNMLPFCFNKTNISDEYLNNINKIMKNNKLVLSKSCLEIVLLKHNDTSFINYINFFKTNNYKFNSDEVIQNKIMHL
jgi:hypothetical protein